MIRALSFAIASSIALYSLPGHAQKMFRCVDDKGVTHFGETMPVACAKKPVTELNKTGRVVRELDAPLTAEQQKERAEKEAKQREIDKLIAEQRLKDEALLSSYGTEKEFDTLRARELAQIDLRQKALERRAADVQARVQKFEKEMEFYTAGRSKSSKGDAAPPADLVNSLDRARADQKALQGEAQRLDKDRAATVQRYETERVRWRKLKTGMTPGTILDKDGNVVHAAPPRRAPAAPR